MDDEIDPGLSAALHHILRAKQFTMQQRLLVFFGLKLNDHRGFAINLVSPNDFVIEIPGILRREDFNQNRAEAAAKEKRPGQLLAFGRGTPVNRLDVTPFGKRLVFSVWIFISVLRASEGRVNVGLMNGRSAHQLFGRNFLVADKVWQ